MHNLSISQISDLTGRDRRTVAKQLKDLHYTAGERGTFLYESTEALPLVDGSSSHALDLRSLGRFVRVCVPFAHGCAELRPVGFDLRCDVSPDEDTRVQHI